MLATLARLSPLVRIKLLHTAAWALFAGSIVLIPITAALGQFPWSAILSALVWLECAILALNRCRCPLTDVAARHTAERAHNFDIYLPERLAQYNKQIFGTLFVLGEIYLVWRWLSG
ncbi:MAG: hypothetical protein IH602_14835 [Bryobacteraceae bacterium]|nr:hypothetical protein [Bryobacteraceae bacterium]